MMPFERADWYLWNELDDLWEVSFKKMIFLFVMLSVYVLLCKFRVPSYYLHSLTRILQIQSRLKQICSQNHLHDDCLADLFTDSTQ